jgi:hypothetical protein
MNKQSVRTFGTMGGIFVLASFGFVSNVMGYGSGGGGVVIGGGGGGAFNWSNYSAPVVNVNGGKVLGATTTATSTFQNVRPAGFKFNVNMAQGSRHPDVRKLQTVLVSAGLLNGRNQTGFYGPLTTNAVRTFQRLNSINPTGFTGPQTRAALNR